MYPLLGYMIAGNFDLSLIVINLIVTAGMLMCVFALNDLFDFKILNEENFIEKQIKSGELTEGRVLFYCFLPLATFPLIIFTGFIPTLLASTFLIAAVLYSLPPVRLKERKYGWTTNMFCWEICFLQAFFAVGGIWRMNVAALLILLFIFQTYLEVIHVKVDCEVGDIEKMKPENAEKALYLLPSISLFVSLMFSLLTIFFLVTAFFSILRVVSLLRSRNESNVLSSLRFSSLGPFLSPLYSSYEFLIYGVLGALHEI
jgi:hypothetical protein